MNKTQLLLTVAKMMLETSRDRDDSEMLEELENSFSKEEQKAVEKFYPEFFVLNSDEEYADDRSEKFYDKLKQDVVRELEMMIEDGAEDVGQRHMSMRKGGMSVAEIEARLNTEVYSQYSPPPDWQDEMHGEGKYVRQLELEGFRVINGCVIDKMSGKLRMDLSTQIKG